MALLGSDFQKITNLFYRRCSECGHVIPVGADMLASIRGGKARKVIVCSEACRSDFDTRMWQEIADKNARRRAERE